MVCSYVLLPTANAADTLGKFVVKSAEDTAKLFDFILDFVRYTKPNVFYMVFNPFFLYFSGIEFLPFNQAFSVVGFSPI